MLSISKIKPIILCTIILTIVFILWSLINNNNNDYQHLKIFYGNKVPLEIFPITDSVIITYQLKIPLIDPYQFTSKFQSSEKQTSSRKDIQCMAQNIYFEARGESFMGQVAVARVVMNRVLHGFASTPCKVIYQTTKRSDPTDDQREIIRCQFSWVCQDTLKPSPDNPDYQQAEYIARRVLDHDEWKDEIPNDILFFHNKTVNPRWPYFQRLTIGNHVFYSKKDKSKNESIRNTQFIQQVSN